MYSQFDAVCTIGESSGRTGEDEGGKAFDRGTVRSWKEDEPMERSFDSSKLITSGKLNYLLTLCA